MSDSPQRPITSYLIVDEHEPAGHEVVRFDFDHEDGSFDGDSASELPRSFIS